MREVGFSTYINYVDIVEVYEIYLNPINHVAYKLLYIKHAYIIGRGQVIYS